MCIFYMIKEKASDYLLIEDKRWPFDHFVDSTSMLNELLCLPGSFKWIFYWKINRYSLSGAGTIVLIFKNLQQQQE